MYNNPQTYYPGGNGNMQYLNQHNQDDRFFFAGPFLFGALAGGAVASASRPRPVYVNQSGPGYNPNMPYANSSYSYYYPVFK